MPKSLITDWKRVAKSGHTVDGRIIQPQWLTDMAETYDPEEYTAKLWVDHRRFYGSYGSVKALKAEKDGDAVRLFAKISPSISLLQMNQVWEEKLHFSIEPTEDFAKTGKCYLTGLGMTDEPASLGTDEMRFSRQDGHDFSARYPGEQVPDLRETGSTDDDQMESFVKKLAKFFFKLNEPEPEKKEEPMDEKQFKEFKEAMESTQQTVATMADTVEKFVASKKTENSVDDVVPGTDDESASPSDDDTRFSDLSSGLEALGEKFNGLLDRIEKAAPGTQFTDTTNPADDLNTLY